jgi:antibiotic biosynthesis monooxygenase (ABM) superfamily enzyme
MTILTVFRSRLRSEAEAAYDTLAVEMSQLASQTPGFLDEKHFRRRRRGARHPRAVLRLIQSCGVAESPASSCGSREREARAVLGISDLLRRD